MAGTLVFVHGTGVRQAGYAATLGSIDQGVRARVPGVRVVGADWGDKFGVPEDVGPALPPGLQARDVTGGMALTDADQAAAKWALLTDDPLFELRLIGGLEPAQSVSFGLLPEQIILDRLNQLRLAPPTGPDSGVSDEELARAIGWVRDAPELVAAVQAVGTADEAELADVIASAIVARVLAEHRFDEAGTGPAIALDGAARDALVTRLGQAIAPNGTRGWVADKLKKAMIGFVERRATAAVAGRRAGLMGASIPAIGDILYYQRRGEQVRQLVADTLSQAEPPVVAVGHSLGGIILVDLLSGPQPPAVRKLITAGSQAPLFYLIDALANLRPGAAQPVPFTPWLNIYNPQDFLSFCAERVFPGAPGISDTAVDPGVPFPASHSAYWHHGPVYDLIAAAWPQP